ncbi:MAG TPA: ABC transporter ATP-binding protein [Bacteroidota bacterium]|nr:ABC transporter ATP-binding protein [Bacteroidota bacterium]
MSAEIRLTGEGVSKVFDRRTVFSEVSFSVAFGETLLITGRNGSGKSTLVKIISSVLTPTRGSVTLTWPASRSSRDRISQIGLVAPYLQMFEEFSALENLSIAAGIRGAPYSAREAGELLERLSIDPRRDDPLRTYSSGMKQRVKYAFALLHHPLALILDEPMANLDLDGVAIVRALMAEQQAKGILVVATNDLTDIDRYDRRVELNGSR